MPLHNNHQRNSCRDAPGSVLLTSTVPPSFWAPQLARGMLRATYPISLMFTYVHIKWKEKKKKGQLFYSTGLLFRHADHSVSRWLLRKQWILIISEKWATEDFRAELIVTEMPSSAQLHKSQSSKAKQQTEQRTAHNCKLQGTLLKVKRKHLKIWLM